MADQMKPQKEESKDKMKFLHKVLKVLEKLKNIFLITGISLILVSIIVSIYILNENWNGFSTNNDFFLGFFIRNLDPLSIFLGLLGITLSIYIYGIVKKETKEEKDALDKQIATVKETITTLNSSVGNINSSVTKIDESVGNAIEKIQEVINSYTSLNEVKGFVKRMEIIEEIYKRSKDYRQDLYIMTHSVTYGNIIAHQIKALCDNNDDYEKGNIETVGDFYEKIMKPNYVKIGNFFDAIIHRARDNKREGKINYMVLNKDKYIQMIERIAKTGEIIGFEKFSSESFTKYRESKNQNYLLKIKNNEDNSEKPEKAFVNRLITYNEEKFKQLEAEKKIAITRVERLPFQFIASVPRDGGAQGGSKCIVIFTNMFSGSTIETVTCFQSTNDQLIRNLIDIYKSYIGSHDDKENKNKTFKDFFNLSKNGKIGFVLHEIVLNGKSGSGSEDHVRFRDDIIAERAIKQFFNSKDRESLLIDDEIISDNIYRDAIENNFVNEEFKEIDKYETIINIGLFENKLTEFLLEDHSKNKRLFKIVQNKDFTKKNIHYTFDMNVLENQWKHLESCYHCKNDSTFDIGVLAKIRFGKKTIFICGGCESYGTRKMGEYLITNWEKLVGDEENKANQNIRATYTNSQFVSVYKIPHEELIKNGEKITLEHHFSI